MTYFAWYSIRAFIPQALKCGRIFQCRRPFKRYGSDGVQSKEKVLTKASFLNQVFKIPVCCRNNNTVDGLGFSPPKTYDFLVIQGFQKLCL